MRRDRERVLRIADELHTSSYGETHTFTEVAQFGGGLVGLLNDLSGNPVRAPECNPANPEIQFVPPGGKTDPDFEEPGVHHYQCCIRGCGRTSSSADAEHSPGLNPGTFEPGVCPLWFVSKIQGSAKTIDVVRCRLVPPLARDDAHSVQDSRPDGILAEYRLISDSAGAPAHDASARTPSRRYAARP